MTIKEIVKKYLEDNGFDGLAGDNCGCTLSDLMSCDTESIGDCEAGHTVGSCGCVNKHSDYCGNYKGDSE